jgi:hypothetical protein
MRSQVFKLLAMLAMAVIFASTVYAQIYKWVDKEGKVHYGDCPPVDCEPEQIDVLPNPDEEDVKSAIKRNQQLIQEQDARYQKRKVEKELAQEKARARQLAISKRCKISRNRLVLLKQRGVITIVDFDGNLHQPSDEQREQMIKGIEAFIEENCQ